MMLWSQARPGYIYVYANNGTLAWQTARQVHRYLCKPPRNRRCFILATISDLYLLVSADPHQLGHRYGWEACYTQSRR